MENLVTFVAGCIAAVYIRCKNRCTKTTELYMQFDVLITRLVNYAE